MWMSLGLSVALLFNVPFLGNVDFHRLWRSTRHPKPTAADSLPPPWRNASRLALENQFVLAELPDLTPVGSSLRLNADPRDLHVEVDPDSGTLHTASEFGDVDLGTGAAWPLGSYGSMMMSRNFRRDWNQRSTVNLNSLGVNTPSTNPQGPGSGFHVKLGPEIPRGLVPILGSGGPQINVNGSENIRISGTSNWTNQQVGPLGQKRSLFPSLDMQQDLNIQLEGQLSDRIRVNLLQNSANQIPLSNRIAINYRGDEDALFQQVDLGNTNLSLPGTQYVSYSGKNEGLFGMKATSRLGPLDFTLLASKQEGRSERASYGGGASKQTTTIRDVEYIRGVYFFLTDPSDGAFDVQEATLKVYRDDGNASNDVNFERGIALPDPKKWATALSPADSATLGTGRVAIRGQWDLLVPGADRDYEVLGDIYGTGWKILRLTQPLSGPQRLAVTYVRVPLGGGQVDSIGGFRITDTDTVSRLVMKLLRVPPDFIGPSGLGTDAVYDTASALFPLLELEPHNFYNLGGQRIDKSSFKMTIRKGSDQPPKITASTSNGAIPYIEILGLDNLDESTDPPLRGKHDGLVDGTVLNSNLRAFIDFENGTLFFPEVRPFAPRLRNERRFPPSHYDFDKAVSSLLFRRDSLAGDRGTDTEASPAIYSHYIVQGDVDARYFIDLEFTAARATGEISLGRGNLLEGSEVVTINGQPLRRGTDYDIDYDLGRVTLKRQMGPADNLNIDYSYAPLFQQAGRTLIGSAFNLQGRDRSFGGAFMYESRGAQDLRPRLGEEPSRSLIGDLNTDWTFRPQWMTHAVDMLPGVRTTAPSELHIQGEVGASFPNPNTRNQVYIDDMEGVRDAVSLSMDQSHWHWTSVPKVSIPRGIVGRSGVTETMLDLEDHLQHVHNAEIHWYSPYSVVKEHDLKPTLTNAQGGDNTRSVLAISIPRRPLKADSREATLDTLWAGLTYPLDPVGIDLTKSQFIELWVNDFNDHHNPSFESPRIRGRHVKLHIDLGKTSEDQMRAPDERPNKHLDTEDTYPADNQLTVAGDKDEDTGVDGILDAAERTVILPDSNGIYRDLTTSNGTDPEGDDFAKPNDNYEEIDARRWVGTNGTEGDKNVNPFPETEDYNLNGNLDTDEAYFEYTIDLGDAANRYLVTDVQRDYPGVPSDNGWRRYRIPIDDSLRVQFGAPDLSIAQHVRVWLEGMTLPDLPADSLQLQSKEKDKGIVNVQRPLLMLGSVDIVGSRWRAVDLDTTEAQAGATLTLNSVNTVDNAEIYEAPFDPGTTRNGNQELTRREQSISLEFSLLRGRHTIEAYKTFSIDEDYSRYGKLNWFATGFGVHDSLGGTNNAGLYYFVRFASDELGRNYYEYRAPVPVSSAPRGKAWKEVLLNLTDLSGLKLLFPTGIVRDTTKERSPGSNEWLSIVGNPSFTRLRRISFGLIDQDTTGYYRDGQLWFDELRATDVFKDRGHAERMQVSGRFANLLQYNVSWNSRDENFISVGETRGSGTATNSLGFSSGIDLHRFFEGTGIILPVGFNFTQGRQRPRYSAGSDVVRDQADLTRSEAFSDNRSWNVAYSRSWSTRANPFLLYTLGGITASYNTSNSHNRSPSGADVTSTSSGAVNYNIAPRSLLALPMPFTPVKFFPLPERFYASYRFDQRESSTSYRDLNTLVLSDPNRSSGHSGSISLGSDTRPFDFYHHHIEAVRNLNLPSPGLFGGALQFGRVVTWSQTNDASWSPRFLPWARPQFTWSSRFSQNNGPELSRDLSVRAIQNGQQGTLRWELPFGNLAAASPLARLQAARPDTSRGAVKRPAPALWRRMLSRFGTVQAELGMNRGSSYSRVLGIPDFFYLFGLHSDPGVGDPGSGSRMTAATGNQGQTSTGWRTSGRTSVQLPWNMVVQTSGDFDSRFATANGAERGQTNLRFPDVTLDYGQVASVLGIDRVVRNVQLRSAANRQVSNEYANGHGPKTGVTTSIQYRPLLSLSGDLPNGMRIELGTEHRHSDREQFQLGTSLTQDVNTNVNLNLTRSYTQGQRVSFLGRETTVRSSISIGINSTYERQTGRILQNGIERNPVRRDRLSLNATGTYGFSSNVSGNAILGFSQDRDQLRAIVNRSLRVELSARFGL